jgi:3-oxoacyl-[acyl-carrier protein] reductase
MRLKNKVAVVTGASRGIGRAIAVKFCEEGADVVVNYISDAKVAKQVVDQIVKIGRKGKAVKADISKMSGVEKLVRDTIDNFKKVDILVNNAGVLLRKSYEESTERTWNKTMDTNLKSIYFLTKKFSKYMVKQKNGKVINIASQAGLAAVNSSLEYSLSKAGVIHLTRSLAKVLAPFINVNCISPGRTTTDMTGYAENPKKRRIKEKNIPLGRVNEPEDIAKLAVFLASKDSRNITGQTISVDGGEIL